jgi:hypothetical protein
MVTSTSSRGRMTAFVLIAIGAIGVACQVVAGIERVEKDQKAAGDGGTTPNPDGSSSGSSGIPANDPCKHAIPEAIPAKDDDPENTIPAFYMAVKTLKITQDGAGGLDLDEVCTCEKGAGTARDGGSSCKPKTTDCDGPNGIDNRGAALFKKFEIGGQVSVDQSASQDIDEGKRSLLVHISEWNGKPNDREIKVGVLVSPGITTNGPCNNDTSPEPGHFKPKWCGSDKWDYNIGTTVQGPNQLFPIVRGLAYVVNNAVVFRSEGSIATFFGRATLNLGSPIMTGKLEKTAGGQWRLAGGILSGRIPIEELLAAIGQFSDPTGGTNPDGSKRLLCEARDVFNLVKPEICNGVDIAKLRVGDFQGGNCNAVSTAISFDAEQAILGGEKPTENSDNRCSPNQITDPSLYQCP